MTFSSPKRVGRFAPSPTGPLHMGSLIGALASYLDARSHQGQWLVRIEDLDPPREIPGAAQAILDSLKAHGLQWDRDVLWQSQRYPAYQQALDQLVKEGKAFYCSCSRAKLSSCNGVYNGHCRSCRVAPPQKHAIRVQVPAQVIGLDDAIQGRFEQQLENDVGDFIILRKDKLFAYQLAVVVDDAFQGITDIVRGSDLLDSTPRQIYLQQQLGLHTPQYAHFPVLQNAEGQKLSKQTFASAIKSEEAAQNLLFALRFLNQSTPPDKRHTEDILEYAIANWQPENIPASIAMIELPDGSFACSAATQ